MVPTTPASRRGSVPSMRRWISVWRRPTSSGVIAASLAHQEGRAGMDALHRQARPAGPVATAARSAASATATTGTSSVLEPRSWRAPDSDDLAGHRDQRRSGAQFVDGPGRVSCDVPEHRRHRDERRCSVLLCPDRNAVLFSDR